MAKVINIRKPHIDIEFKDDEGNVVLAFKFDKSDDAQQRILDVQNEVMASLSKAELDEEYTIKKLNKDIERAFDSLLGEGSFNKLYELSPSWEIMIYYFVEICGAIAEETHTSFDEMNVALEKYASK